MLAEQRRRDERERKARALGDGLEREVLADLRVDDEVGERRARSLAVLRLGS